MRTCGGTGVAKTWRGSREGVHAHPPSNSSRTPPPVILHPRFTPTPFPRTASSFTHARTTRRRGTQECRDERREMTQQCKSTIPEAFALFFFVLLLFYFFSFIPLLSLFFFPRPPVSLPPLPTPTTSSLPKIQTILREDAREYSREDRTYMYI